MRNALIPLLIAALLSCGDSATPPAETPDTNPQISAEPIEYALVVHGGAGTILKENMTNERAVAIRAALDSALRRGEDILAGGGSATDAVEQAIWVLEDSPFFNAGRGAVFTSAGTNELDASFMRGEDLEAGAVGGVTNVKHPISAARAVLERSEHVMLSGPGAEQFATEAGLETVDPTYFYTEERYQSLRRIQAEEAGTSPTGSLPPHYHETDTKFGTVGCVALDKNGNLAAGTSTGGMTNKRYNRIGDSPIIGAGTYANNATCGVSCTGHGEFFIRYAVAHDVHARMAYGGVNLATAAQAAIFGDLQAAGGTGGLIALDRAGNVAMPFNTAGMYRGYRKSNGETDIQFYDTTTE